MKVETIKYKDVRGKELLYIKISNGGKESLINVGQKTYDDVTAVVNAKEVTNGENLTVTKDPKENK